MHLHFVFPKWKKLLEDHPGLRDLVSGYDVGNFRMAGLGVATAAGAVPADHRVSLCDQNVAEVDFGIDADLICIGFFTPQASNAYRIADGFRAMGKVVVAGGIHPTVMPEEAAHHFDTVIRGPAEGVWEAVLSDLAGGGVKPLYSGHPSSGFAQPRRDIFKDSAYLQAGTIQTARGCSAGCSFCVVPENAGKSIFHRPVDEVLNDIAVLPFPCFFFADENLLFPDSNNRMYREELFSRMAESGNRKISFIAAYPQYLKHLRTEDIPLMNGARLRQIYLVLGLKNPLAVDLCDRELAEKIIALKAAGIEVMASFNLGHDGDERPVESLIENFCMATGTNLAEFVIHTPFPGTEMFAEFESAGRLLTRDWSLYNGANVVFHPLHELPDQLLRRYLALWRWFYGDINQEQILSRYVRGFGGGIIRK